MIKGLEIVLLLKGFYEERDSLSPAHTTPTCMGLGLYDNVVVMTLSCPCTERMLSVYGKQPIYDSLRVHQRPFIFVSLTIYICRTVFICRASCNGSQQVGLQ